MPDTPQSRAVNLNNFRDNNSGAITAQELRNFLVSIWPPDATGVLVNGGDGDMSWSNTVSISITGNAATVTTNANLTGDVTSSGSNATTVAKIAGKTVSGTTGTGNVVFSNSPTLIVPALGTPTSGVLTNCTGTASGLTAGHVTTNANMTGDVTSVGNATTIAKINGVTYIFPASQGAAGTVLTDSDGAGTLLWVAPSGAVTSVSNSDNTLVVTPTTGDVVASLNLAQANTWTAVQVLPSLNSDGGLITSDTAGNLTAVSFIVTTTTINTVPYTWPASQGAAGTVLTDSDGAGTLLWVAPSGAVTSVSNSDNTLVVTPTTGDVVASLNLAQANTWTAVQVLPSLNSDGGLITSDTAGNLTAVSFIGSGASLTNIPITAVTGGTNNNILYTNNTGVVSETGNLYYSDASGNMVITGAADAVELTVTSFTGQTSNLQNWTDSSNNSLAWVDVNGNLATPTLYAGATVINTVPYTWPNTQGATGSVLTDSDGAGTLTWVTGSLAAGNAGDVQLSDGAGNFVVTSGGTFNVSVDGFNNVYVTATCSTPGSQAYFSCQNVGTDQWVFGIQNNAFVIGDVTTNQLPLVAVAGVGVGLNMPGNPPTPPINACDISGGCVIGADYAGVTTAPTNGLSVEGSTTLDNGGVTTDGAGTITTVGIVTTNTTFNTVSYSFPSTQGAAYTSLQNDGTGILTWVPQQLGPGTPGPFAGVWVIPGGETWTTVPPTTVVKTSGGNWSCVYTQEAYGVPITLSFQFTDLLTKVMAGLTNTPNANPGSHYNDINYAWYNATVGLGGTYIYENGSSVAGPFTYTAATVLSITYDGTNVRYYANGSVIRTVAASNLGSIYAEVAIFDSASAGINSIVFNGFLFTTGTGNVVLSNSPTLVTPTLGTPASGVLTNCTGTASGLTAGNVTTNANMTGDVTSSGSNATTVAKIAGVAVGTPTGTGNVVLSNSPTLVTPALGTPASGVLTNCTGTASGLTAGNVTTNANMTGDVTSSGSNATTVAKIAGVAVGTPTGTGNVVLSNSPTLVTPALGTPASGVLTNCTGTASGLTAGNVTTNANMTGDVTSSGSNATTVAKIAGVAVGTPTGTGNVVFSAAPTLTGITYLNVGTLETKVYANGSSGSSFALNLDNGNLQSITITGAVTITQTTPTHPGKYTLVVTQDGSGHVYSFSGIKWNTGVQPTWSTTPSAIDVVSIIYDGTYYYGMGGTGFA